MKLNSTAALRSMLGELNITVTKSNFIFIIILSAVCIVHACSSSSSTPGGNIEDLALEVQKGSCVTRLETLLFQINGIVYECDGDVTGSEVIEMLPDSLLSCPVLDVLYSFDYDSRAILLICPNGHGGIAASLE